MLEKIKNFSGKREKADRIAQPMLIEVVEEPKPKVDIYATDAASLRGLPDELKSQLKKAGGSKKRRRPFNADYARLWDIITRHPSHAITINEILLAYYRTYGVVLKRTQINSKLHYLKAHGCIQSVRKGKGYSFIPVQKSLN